MEFLSEERILPYCQTKKIRQIFLNNSAGNKHRFGILKGFAFSKFVSNAIFVWNAVTHFLALHSVFHPYLEDEKNRVYIGSIDFQCGARFGKCSNSFSFPIANELKRFQRELHLSSLALTHIAVLGMP